MAPDVSVGLRHDAMEWAFAVMAREWHILRAKRADGAERGERVGGVAERANAAELGGDAGVGGHGDVVDDDRVTGRRRRGSVAGRRTEASLSVVDAALPFDDAQAGLDELGGHGHDIALRASR